MINHLIPVHVPVLAKYPELQGHVPPLYVLNALLEHDVQAVLEGPEQVAQLLSQAGIFIIFTCA